MKFATTIPAMAGGILSIATALVFWPIHTTHGVVAPILIALLAFGTMAVASALLRQLQPQRDLLIMICTSGLAACGFAGLMSIGPFALLSALLVLLSAAMDGSGRRKVVAEIALFTAISVVVFAILFTATIRMGVRKVAIPQDTGVTRAFRVVDYSDAFRIDVHGFGGDIEEVARTFVISMRPSWLITGRPGSGVHQLFEPGSAIGDWRVHQRTNNEIVFGLDRSFIDLRISVLMREETTHMSVTATTVVQYNNWMGSVYFLPVRYGHQIVLADTMRKTKAALTAARNEKVP